MIQLLCNVLNKPTRKERDNMLELIFFSKSKRPDGTEKTDERASIFSTEKDKKEDESDFIKGNIRFGEISVYEFDTLGKFHIPNEILETIENIVQNNKPEAILISDLYFFRRVVHYSTRDEMEPQMAIAKNREMLYYSMIGEGKCALLVTWDSLE